MFRNIRKYKEACCFLSLFSDIPKQHMSGNGLPEPAGGLAAISFQSTKLDPAEGGAASSAQTPRHLSGDSDLRDATVSAPLGAGVSGS
jgi:hypothetical protein